MHERFCWWKLNFLPMRRLLKTQDSLQINFTFRGLLCALMRMLLNFGVIFYNFLQEQNYLELKTRIHISKSTLR